MLGVADTAKGESRRNENVQFNLIDNNAFKELAIRLGSTATVVQEFEADKNYFSAEFGKTPAGEIHLKPASGTDLHGRLHYRHLNSVTSARSFFQVGGVKPARENAYGATVTSGLWGGAFLTLRASRQAIRGNVNGNVLVPLPEERTPLTTDPKAREIVSTLLAVFPDEAPNRPDINPRMLNTNSPQSIDDDILGAKLDQQLGEKNYLAFDYSFFLQFVDGFQLIRTQNPDTTTRNHRARITYTRAISSATTFDATVGFERVGSLLTQEDFPLRRGVFVSSALTPFGNGSFIPIDRSTNNFRYAAQVRREAGRHSFHWGGRVYRAQINGSESDSHRGVFSFSRALGEDAVTNFRLGRPTNYYKSFGSVHRGFRNWSGGLFAGDQWRVANELTLSYGLRWGFYGRATEVDEINVVPYDDDANNFAPRFGFAWRLPEEAGVIRGAFGVHYGRIFDVTYMQMRFNAPQSVKVVVPLVDITNPDAGINVDDLNDVRGLVYSLDPELTSPYSMQYNLSWEREIGGAWTLDLGYVGSRSPKLFAQWYQNRAEEIPGLVSTLGNVNERRPDASILERRRVLNGSRGYFDAAKIVLRAPRWRRFSACTLGRRTNVTAAWRRSGSHAGTVDLRPPAERRQHEDVGEAPAFVLLAPDRSDRARLQLDAFVRGSLDAGIRRLEPRVVGVSLPPCGPGVRVEQARRRGQGAQRRDDAQARPRVGFFAKRGDQGRHRPAVLVVAERSRRGPPDRGILVALESDAQQGGIAQRLFEKAGPGDGFPHPRTWVTQQSCSQLEHRRIARRGREVPHGPPAGAPVVRIRARKQFVRGRADRGRAKDEQREGGGDLEGSAHGGH